MSAFNLQVTSRLLPKQPLLQAHHQLRTTMWDTSSLAWPTCPPSWRDPSASLPLSRDSRPTWRRTCSYMRASVTSTCYTCQTRLRWMRMVWRSWPQSVPSDSGLRRYLVFKLQNLLYWFPLFRQNHVTSARTWRWWPWTCCPARPPVCQARDSSASVASCLRGGALPSLLISLSGKP